MLLSSDSVLLAAWALPGMASSTRVLEEGMLVALEPHIGYWHL